MKTLISLHKRLLQVKYNVGFRFRCKKAYYKRRINVLYFNNLCFKFCLFFYVQCFLSICYRLSYRFDIRPLSLSFRYKLSFRSCKNNIRPQQFHESAIGQHLLDNAQCALHYSNEKFSILARGRSSFHLSALEATFIKSLNPLLCKQKEFVYSLKIS